MLERALSEHRELNELHSLITLVKKFDAPLRRFGNEEPSSDLLGQNMRQMKEEFVASLRTDRQSTARVMRRLRAIATRLGLQITEKKETAIVEIDAKLDTLGDKELRNIISAFSNHQRVNKPDEGFLGLANYILNKDKDT
jgi:hypothetical protein